MGDMGVAGGGGSRGETVVVGVDGTPGSDAALRWALADAVHRAGCVRAVTVGPAPEYWVTTYGMAVVPPVDEVLRDLRTRAQVQVDAGRAALGGGDAPPVEVDVRLGHAAEELVAASRGAAQLVLGHRGRGPLRSALLGSVGLHCVLHAHCPVTVVRPGAGDGAADVAEPGAALAGRE